jgi:hypothetical protein
MDRRDRRRGGPAIGSKYLADLWPAMAQVQVETSMGIGHWWELPYGERSVIDAIVRYVKPPVSFEFGTFSGSTTGADRPSRAARRGRPHDRRSR